MTFLLIDLRLEPQQIDMEFMNWLNKKNINFKIIFTKEDKLKVTQKENKAESYIKNTFKETNICPEFIVSSSKTKKGRDEILKLIYSDL
jgi:GTP-binding protein